MTAAAQPYAARYACLDLLAALDRAALGDLPAEQCEGSDLAVRWLVEALEAVIRNSPGSAEYLEHPLAEAARAMGVEG